ncbi:PP2C family serine/threonine-protein phosphatase [Nocardia barduliensis]|uniref:PP2C family serine/threonine-protein phosphatase n=1 Tax=Nocardia barduliensis TaxID=2736643 RepID=UPI001574E279|nr:PP2C family serine/threonine-protein phosphatase [Nocardia barduliensis]
MRGAGAVWTAVTSTVTGPGHVRSGLPNQDRKLVRSINPRCCLFAVADGAGSYRRSDQGAELAVGAAWDAAEHVFGAGMPNGLGGWSAALRDFQSECLERFDRGVFELTRRVLAEHPDEPETEIRASFATTLLAVVAQPPYFLYVSVGDCFLVVHRDPGGPRLVVTASPRENVGATTFLTSGNRNQHIQSHVIVDDRITAMAVCSDGLAEGMLTVAGTPNGDLHYQAPPEFRKYFDYFGRHAAADGELEAYLKSAQFAATSTDDKTVVLAVRRSAPAQQVEVHDDAQVGQ